ncbi:MAG TPA: bifunctional ADP-heptose synthase, partial [Anaerohalosphaeraceae bacterium]|nr:bifunctional ADP-heptose synthase [Anaerohalosphaeraceae bacterium]
MYERLMDIFNDVGTPRILLVGDFMIDHYVFGDTDRISPEAPVMVMNVTERQVRPGGAGSVAADLAILGADVACVGIVGRDANGEKLRSLLQATGSVNMEGVLAVEGRPTTSKQRIIGLAQHRHRQQLMRIDEECSLDIGEEIRSQLLRHIHKLLTWCDVVCLEDYNKGVLCPAFCREIIRLANQQGKKTIIDPARISDYSRYAGCWAIKPNRRELSLATGIEVNGEESWRTAAEKLARDLNISNVIVTLDKQGSYLYQQTAGEGSGELIPTRARNVYDVTGAGDMVLAMLGYLVGGHYRQASLPALKEIVCLGNVAGGLEVERFG